MLKLKKEDQNVPKKKLNLGFLKLIGHDDVDLSTKGEVQELKSCDNSCNCYSCDTCY